MKIDFKEVYVDRIRYINKQIKAAIKDKKWTEKAKLEAEKVNLQKKIEEIDHGR